VQEIDPEGARDAAFTALGRRSSGTGLRFSFSGPRRVASEARSSFSLVFGVTEVIRPSAKVMSVSLPPSPARSTESAVTRKSLALSALAARA
jgi:hypothetical protein